jgi:hypothetical protein
MQRQEWIESQFSGILGDKRRRNRVVTIAKAMADTPGVSIPRLFLRKYDVKAAYSLFQHWESTPENLQVSHRQQVRARIEQPGTYLLIEDTSEVSWNGEPKEGLGIINANPGKGFLLHTVLAALWPQLKRENGLVRRPHLELLGIADQQYNIRVPIPPGERDTDSFSRQKRNRESQVWEVAGNHLGPAKEAHWIRVCDRGADIFEFLQQCKQLGHGFIVRASSNRILESDVPKGPTGKLFERARQASALGGFELELRSRPAPKAGKRKIARNAQKNRIARLSISTVPVVLQSPKRPGAAPGKFPGLHCTAVRVWEDAAPAGTDPLEWILLVDREIQDFQQALECTLQYTARWLIEEFHKVLKMGLGAERLQLEEASRLYAAIAIMSVVAVRLLDLKERLRLFPDEPAENSGLEALEIKVLGAYLKRELKTVKDVAMAIGRLGGHLNRKADGMPGIVSLWQGLTRLREMVEGVRLALEFKQGYFG